MPKKVRLPDLYIPNPEVSMNTVLSEYFRIYNNFTNNYEKMSWLTNSGFYPHYQSDIPSGTHDRYVAWKNEYLSNNEFMESHIYFEKYPKILKPLLIVQLFVYHGYLDILNGPNFDTYPHIEVVYHDDDIQDIQAALNRDKPFKWLDNEILFGNQLWKLSKNEEFMDEEELRYLFLEVYDKERRKFDRLRKKYSGVAGEEVLHKREHIAEEVRIYVWRRDQGKCVYCNSNKKLEYDHIIPVSKGGSNTARNIQLLCEACNRTKSAKIQ